MKVVVSGLMASYPMGGMTWHYLQYLIGLQRMGFEVFYIEDTGWWPYSPQLQTFVEDPTDNVAYLSALMQRYGLEDCWSYRDATKGFLGASRERALSAFQSADLFLNVSGACWLRPEYQTCGCSVYIDTDPGYSQIKVAKVAEGDDDKDLVFSVDRMADHQHHFTFGENTGKPGCRVPTDRFNWRPTRQPIVLDEWAPAASGGETEKWTTVMSWSPYAKPLEFHGERYYGKEAHLERLLNLPQKTGFPMELAMSGEAPLERLRNCGWGVVEAGEISASADSYRDYIQSSKAEFSVAKDIYISSWSGWFSERSACYLAAGKPVVTEDTGFTELFPTGQGLLAYETLGQAEACVNAVMSDYSRHSEAARGVAETFFDAEKGFGEACA